MPKRSPWRLAPFDTLRLRLIKIAARVGELKTKAILSLPSSCPARPVLALLLQRTVRLVT